MLSALFLIPNQKRAKPLGSALSISVKCGNHPVVTILTQTKMLYQTIFPGEISPCLCYVQKLLHRNPLLLPLLSAAAIAYESLCYLIFLIHRNPPISTRFSNRAYFTGLHVFISMESSVSLSAHSSSESHLPPVCCKIRDAFHLS